MGKERTCCSYPKDIINRWSNHLFIKKIKHVIWDREYQQARFPVKFEFLKLEAADIYNQKKIIFRRRSHYI